MDKVKRVEILKESLVNTCTICNGKGYIDFVEEKLVHCSCMERFKVIRALWESKIPEEYWALDIDTISIQEKERNIITEYVGCLKQVALRGAGILFYGPNGVGKTTMQCLAGIQALIQGYGVRYVTAQSYIRYTQKNEDVSEYEKCDFLLLDELDKVYIKQNSDYVSKTLEDFLRRVLQVPNVILACTNAIPDELADLLGNSIVSVMKSKMLFMGVSGSDFRETQQKGWMNLLGGTNLYQTEKIAELGKSYVKARS